MVTLMALLACAGPEPVDSGAAAVSELPPTSLLARASLDLRGVRPTVAELERVEANPDALQPLIEDYLQDSRLGARMVDLYSPVYLTQADRFQVSAADMGIDSDAAFTRSVGQEPLRLIAHLTLEDRPWTELVQADYTLANEVLARFYPVDYPEGERGWRVSRYTDGRPPVGVLASSSVYLRYPTSGFNGNRSRASAFARVLLCDDYLARPIEFDRSVDLLDEQAVNAALQTNASCVACHSTLDPLSGYFYGFMHLHGFSPYDYIWYHPEREFMWQEVTGVAPGYFGQPGEGLEELSYRIASDPRMVECAVQQVREQLLQRPQTAADTAEMAAHREDFMGEDLQMRALLRSVVASPTYRALPQDGGVRKLLTPAQLASALQDLTGYRFLVDGYDMLQNDSVGLRVLAGGIDSALVTRRSTYPTATMTLVQERMAQAAAQQAVLTPDGGLFAQLSLSAPADDQALEAQLDQLTLRTLSRRASADELAELGQLWRAMAQDSDPQTAWAGVLSVLLRDPSFLLY